MKRSNFISTVVVFLGGALTAFLWLPLLPLVVPLVTLALGIRWASAGLTSDSRLGNKVLSSKLLYFPVNKHISPSQAAKPTAWPSSASLSSPARADSLPLLRKDTKPFKKQLRENRLFLRVINGEDLRKSVSANG